MDTETLPRIHEDAMVVQVIGQPIFHDHLGNLDNGDLEYVVVYAFGPDTYYHAIRVAGTSGVILDRRCSDIEAEMYGQKFDEWFASDDSRIGACLECEAAEAKRAEG